MLFENGKLWIKLILNSTGSSIVIESIAGAICFV